MNFDSEDISRDNHCRIGSRFNYLQIELQNGDRVSSDFISESPKTEEAVTYGTFQVQVPLPGLVLVRLSGCGVIAVALFL